MRLGLTMIGVLLVSALLSPAEDWPRWRGPDANGMTSAKNWNPAALKDGMPIRWTRELGKGHASASVRDGRLYSMGNVDDHDVVYCPGHARARRRRPVHHEP